MNEDDFERFWAAYPRRIAKGRARTAFKTAIKLTDLETMLKAIDTYKRRKPERIDFKHPATWLNGECWDDEWPEPAKSLSGGAPRTFDYKPSNVVPIRSSLPDDHFSKRYERGEFNQQKAGE